MRSTEAITRDVGGEAIQLASGLPLVVGGALRSGFVDRLDDSFAVPVVDPLRIAQPGYDGADTHAGRVVHELSPVRSSKRTVSGRGGLDKPALPGMYRDVKTLTPNDCFVIRERHTGWEKARPGLLAAVFGVSVQRINAVLADHPTIAEIDREGRA